MSTPAEPTETRRLRRGDVREDGKVFWAYGYNYPNGERWVTREKFDEKIAREKARSTRRPRSARAHLVRGDRREDGKIFFSRCPGYANGERWVTPEEFEVLQQSRRDRDNSRYASDPKYKISKNVQCAIGRAVKFAGQSKPSRSFELLGADLETFKAHIEAQFVNGMTWENHGEWHIDHVVPLASGKTPEEIWQLCHYTNLQPLWAVDNIRKGARLPENFCLPE